MYSQERLFIKIRTILTQIFCVCCFVTLFLPVQLVGQKQSYHTLRSFQTVPHALQFDLGKLPKFRFFVGPPYVSNINVTMKAIGPSVGDLGILGSTNSLFDNDYQSLLNKAEDFNAIEVDNKIDLVYFGYRVRDQFFSLHITDNVQARGFYTNDLLRLFNDIDNTPSDGFAGGQYDLAQLGANGVHFRSFGLGYRRAVNEYVSIGIKVKYLQGLSTIRTRNNGFGLTAAPGDSRFTIQNDINILYSGVAFLGKDSLGLADYFVGNANGNIGFGVDLGLNLQLNDQLEFFVTAIDIGGFNMKNRVQEYSFNNSSLNLSTEDLQAFEDELDNKLEQAFLSEELADTTLNVGLTSQAFVGGTYRFKKKYTIGAVANPKFKDGSIDFGGSVAFTALVNEFIELAANVNFDQDNFNVGTGFVFNGGPFQLYAASDNILSAFQLYNSDNLAISTGINFVFGRPKSRKRKRKKKFKKPVEETLSREELMMEELLAREEATEEEEPPVEEEEAPVEEEQQPPGEEEEQSPEEEEEPINDDVLLNGIAVDSKTNEKLTGISIEFYRLKDDGSREVLLFHGFYNGNISLHVKNTADHVLVVKKQGYGIKEFKILKEDLQGRSTVNRQFSLSKQG